jgi:hypothetical protein
MRLIHVIACDDIRQDAFGQWCFLGIKPPIIEVYLFPYRLRMQIVALLEVENGGQTELSFEIVDGNDLDIHSSDIDFIPIEGEMKLCAICGVNVEYQKETTLFFKARVRGQGEWQKVSLLKMKAVEAA